MIPDFPDCFVPLAGPESVGKQLSDEERVLLALIHAIDAEIHAAKTVPGPSETLKITYDQLRNRAGTVLPFSPPSTEGDTWTKISTWYKAQRWTRVTFAAQGASGTLELVMPR